jgi:hypothetical protein
MDPKHLNGVYPYPLLPVFSPQTSGAFPNIPQPGAFPHIPQWPPNVPYTFPLTDQVSASLPLKVSDGLVTIKDDPGMPKNKFPSHNDLTKQAKSHAVGKEFPKKYGMYIYVYNDVNSLIIGCLDGDNTSSDWPNGSEHREYILGTEPHKWKETKWAWRSQGHVNQNGRRVEMRICLGVISCTNPACERLLRPKTEPGARKIQLQGECQLCSSHLIQYKCEARSYHYQFMKQDSPFLVWEHVGNHC